MPSLLPEKPKDNVPCCANCVYYQPEMTRCRRFPHYEQRSVEQWCGEFKPLRKAPKPARKQTRTRKKK